MGFVNDAVAVQSSMFMGLVGTGVVEASSWIDTHFSDMCAVDDLTSPETPGPHNRSPTYH